MTNEPEKTKESDWSKVWGLIYLMIGIASLCFSIYSIMYDIKNIVPIYGTMIASVLIGALAILVIIYGYRVFKKDI